MLQCINYAVKTILANCWYGTAWRFWIKMVKPLVCVEYQKGEVF